MPRAHLSSLERLLARKKQLASLAVSLDGYDRWGLGSDPEFASKAQTELQERPEVVARLEDLIGKLKQSDPDVLVAWAEAHIEVLGDFLTRVPEDSTEAFVARREREQWTQVRDGALDYVDENSVFVKPDAELYERLFGFPPPHLHW